MDETPAVTDALWNRICGLERTEHCNPVKCRHPWCNITPNGAASFDINGRVTLAFSGPDVRRAQCYRAIRRNTRTAVKRERPDALTKGVATFHDNAPPQVTRTLRDPAWWKVLDHLLYGPDLSPRSFHVFGALKNALEGLQIRFDARSATVAAVHRVLSCASTVCLRQGPWRLLSTASTNNSRRIYFEHAWYLHPQTILANYRNHFIQLNL
jgi:hypothetical protein